MNKEKALRWAATNGHIEIVRLLIANGANLGMYKFLTIHNTEYFGHTEISKLLREKFCK